MMKTNNITKIVGAILLTVCLTGTIFAQGVGINTTGAQPDPSAMLDVNSTTGGVLISRMTTAQRDAISAPAVGLEVFNTDTDCFNFWNGSTWRQSCYDCDFSQPTVGNNGPLCEGSTLNLTATTVSGATYQWSGPNGFTSTDQNPSISNVTASASGVYSLQVTVSGCTGTPITTVATINATPQTPVASNDGPVCVGGVLNLSSSNIVGAVYNWAGPNGYSSNGQNPTISTATNSNAGTYNVTATVNGCTSANGSTTVSVIDVPGTPGSITGSTSVVSGSTGISYSISSVPTATSYTWTVPSGATVATGQGTTAITVDFAGNAGNVCVTADNTCGSGTANCLAITITYPQSCYAIKTLNPSAPDGVYTIDPDGGGGTFSSFDVYCDMTTDGGGWTLVYRDNFDGIMQTESTGDIGTLSNLQSVSGSSAKYSDAKINAIKGISTNAIGYRTTSPNISNKYFHSGLCNYVHNSSSNSGVPNECMRYVSTYTSSSSPSYIQCGHWGGYGAGINCWYQCNGYGNYTNVVITHKGYTEKSGMTTNTAGNVLGSSGTSYSNRVLLWVK